MNTRPAVNGAEAVTSYEWPEWLIPFVHCLWHGAVASTRPTTTSVSHGVNGQLHASSGGVEETTTGGAKGSKHDLPNMGGTSSEAKTKTTPIKQGFGVSSPNTAPPLFTAPIKQGFGVSSPNIAPPLFTAPPQDRRRGPPTGLLNGLPTGLPTGGLPTDGHQSSPIKINNGLVPTVGVAQRTPPSMGRVVDAPDSQIRVVEAPDSGGKDAKDHPHWSLDL